MLEHRWREGENYLISTTTYAWVGTVVSVDHREVLLDPACRVYDTGRFADALSNGLETLEASELEPAPSKVLINRSAVVDGVLYAHKIPREQK